MIPLGQFRDTFIIAVDDEGIAIIDQHVAHERVLFERMMERLTAGRLESQRLLTPLLIDLSPAQRQALAAHRGDARAARLRGRGVRRRQPAPVGRSGAARRRPSARRRCGRWPRISRASTAVARRGRAGRIAATMACHAAVKANYPLTLTKMRFILDELRRDGVFERLPARPAGGAAADAAGDREEFSADLSQEAAGRRMICTGSSHWSQP